MSIKEISNEAVIKSGRKQLGSLENSLYLHNYVGNYEEISDEFEEVDLHLMDAIESKILKRQKQREAKIYSILGISGIDELNKLYMESGGDSEFFDSSITNVLSEASKSAVVDLSGNTTNKKIDKFNSAVLGILENMIDEEFGKNDKEMAEALKEGLGESTAKKLANRKNDKGRSKNMKKYVGSLSKVLASGYRGEILEIGTGVAMARVMEELVGKNRGKVKLTAKVRNAQGKQIKADNTLVIDNQIEVGISDKNYKTDSKGNVEVSLHSSGSLENFYRLINNGTFVGRGQTDLKAIQSLVEKFKKPNFKYHLINQAAFAGTKNIQDTDVGKNIINFIKQCLPLFIGTQFKIKGDNINVDFFNINGTLIPVSTIMEDCFNGGPLTGLRVGLYSNYQVPWYEILQKKTQNPVENNQYYGEGARQAGSLYGHNLYNKINVGTIHLKVALANFK